MSTPRSLADQLRTWSDDQLVALLRDRPDLGVPLPPDLSALAARATSRVSVQRAIDATERPALQVLEVLAALPEPITPGEVSRRWGAPATSTLTRLRELALVWGTPRGLRLVRAAREVLGPHPAGLGPPLHDALGRRSPGRLAELLDDLELPASAQPTDALDRLAEHLGRADVVLGLLERAPDGVREVLERLTWGPPLGQVAQADRRVRTTDAAGPIEWLLARGLLAVADPGHVVLPREIGLALRGGRVHAAAQVEPPALTLTPHLAPLVASLAAGCAAEAVRLVAALGELWGAAPAPVLRSGGLGMRELRRVAGALELDEATAARTVEIAYAAGLLSSDSDADPRFAPTPAFDAWLAGGTGQRWVELATAWLAMTRCPGLVGSRDERDTPRTALGADLDRAGAPDVRSFVLRTLAGAGDAGTTSTLSAPSPQSLAEQLAWTAPRRSGRARAALLTWALEEAAWLGVTGAGALAPHARALLDGSPSAAAAALERVLPTPVDHILLQADLTAIAPGPLERPLARELALAADVESRGGATVYRFTPGSLRRALDHGRTGEDLIDTLTRHSRTPLPQPLRYLIQDTARRHGRLRVAAAQAYIRADDEAALAELLADRRAAALRLRRLAPTVLAAQASPGAVLEVLRTMGLAPAAESLEGDLLIQRPDEHRTGPRARPRPVSPLPPTPGDAALLSAVQALRAAQAAQDARAAQDGVAAAHQENPKDATDPKDPTDPTQDRPAQQPLLDAVDPAGVLALLRDAVARGQPLWIGYADATGRRSRRLVEPLSVAAGTVSAFDRAAQEVRTFSVHRVTGISRAGATSGPE